MLRLDMHAQHRTWFDACMRARGIAGRHERREPGREDEDPLVAIDYGYLKLDGRKMTMTTKMTKWHKTKCSP